MDSRVPKSRPSGNRLKPLSSSKGPPIVQLIKQKLSNEPSWGYFALNGKWICPYCLSSVNKRSGRSREDSISVHLDTCRGFGNGHGQIQQVEVIARRQQFENLIHLADSDPAWRVYDQTGSWYCPACLDRIASVRIQGGQLTSFVYQAMAEHLSRCGAYLRGARPSPEDVQRARDRAIRFPALLQTLQQNLQFPSWRYLDAMGLWVCPCCLKHVPRVRIAKDTDWGRAPEHIAQHLLQECAAYANDPNAVQPENVVRDAAAASVPVMQPSGLQRTPLPGGMVSPPSNRTPALGNSIPQARSATPSGNVRIDPGMTPPIAKPITGSGRYPLTPPGTSRFPSGHTPIGMRRTDTTPTGAPPVNAPHTNTPTNDNTPKWSPPKGSASISPPINKAPESDQKKNNKDDTLFGKLPEDFLNATSLGGLDEANDGHDSIEPAISLPADDNTSSDSDEERQAFNWMDEAENHEPDSVSIPTPERTDMIKAVAVQQGLMQKPPDIPGYSFGACYEACSDISGDFYQFIRLPDGRVGFALGDVSGHGVQAGLIMSMAKKTFEIYASMGMSPAETLSKVNDSIARDLGGKLFISMVYALLDPTQRTITWARAGHNPSIRFNPDDGEIEEIKPPGMVVGMKSGPMFANSIKEQVTSVRSGDIILLYTDGITETMNLQQEEFETDRLFDVIKKFGSEGPDVLVSRIMEIIRHFRGPQPPSDDATLLALRVD